MATDFERILLQEGRKNPETIKQFLMRSLDNQMVELSIHSLAHETIITLAISDDTAQQFMEATLGDDYERFE